MSTPNTRKFRSTTEVRCPECGKTLSRAADLQRHKDAYHPDGTEVKYVGGTTLNTFISHSLSIGFLVDTPDARTRPNRKVT